MHRNAFGEIKPATADELSRALDETGIEDPEMVATINEPDPQETLEIFQGWTAEVEVHGTVNKENDVQTIETAGFKTRADLVAMLSKAGVSEISD